MDAVINFRKIYRFFKQPMKNRYRTRLSKRRVKISKFVSIPTHAIWVERLAMKSEGSLYRKSRAVILRSHKLADLEIRAFSQLSDFLNTLRNSSTKPRVAVACKCLRARHAGRHNEGRDRRGILVSASWHHAGMRHGLSLPCSS